MRKLVIGAIGLLIATSLFADVVKLREGVPERYVVQKGDTLWDISKMFLDDPWLWPEIWHINTQIENPHLIYPGDVLGLVVIDGKTVLTNLSRGDVQVKVNESGYVEEEIEPGLVKLRPTARVTPIFGAIPAIPREFIDGFLSDNQIIDPNDINTAPYILGGAEGRLVLGQGDRLYARGKFEPAFPAYDIYRAGESYYDPVTEEFLGFEGLNLGMVSFENLEKDIATLTVVRSNQNLSVGDRLLSTDDDTLIGTYFPSAPETDIRGHVLAVMRGVKAIGQFDVVLLSKGAREGLTPGNIMNIWRIGDVVVDPVEKERVRLPSEQAGLLMVFKTFEKMSYGLVLEANRPMGVGDEVRAPGF